MSGYIDAYEVVRLDAGAITGNISHNPSSDTPGPTLGRVQAGSISSVLTSYRGNIGTIQATAGSVSGSITAHIGDIASVQAAGNLTAHIYAPQGTINSITANGTVGASPSSRSVIQAKNRINILTGTNVYADITANLNGGEGILRRLEATAGDFVGSVLMNTLGADASPTADRFSVAGSFIGTFQSGDTINGGSILVPITFGALPAGSTILIGGRLNVLTNPPIWNGRITVGSSNNPGLAGQILILNSAAQPDPWTGPVIVGGPTGTTLSPTPAYSQTSAQLGGGAVGLVPFHLHVEDSALNSPQFASGTARLRFYGPIANTSPQTLPVQVEAWSALGGWWTNVSSNYTAVIAGRDLTLTAVSDLIDDDVPLPMRIRPLSNLVCDPSVVGSAVLVADFDWQFTPQ